VGSRRSFSSAASTFCFSDPARPSGVYQPTRGQVLRPTHVYEPDPGLLLDLGEVGSAVGREEERHAVIAPATRGRGPLGHLETGGVALALAELPGHVHIPALGLDDTDRRQADEESVVGRTVLRRPLGDRQVAALLGANSVRPPKGRRVGLPAGRAKLFVDDLARRGLVEIEGCGGLDGLLDSCLDLGCWSLHGLGLKRGKALDHLGFAPSRFVHEGFESLSLGLLNAGLFLSRRACRAGFLGRTLGGSLGPLSRGQRGAQVGQLPLESGGGVDGRGGGMNGPALKPRSCPKLR
jgi:hypothetical protein